MNKYPNGKGPEDDIAIENDMDMSEDLFDSFHGDKIRDSEVRGLSHRFTILPILLPCLLGGVCLIGYLDLRYRLSQTQTTESRKVETLSTDIVNKIESLSYQYETLDSSVTKRLAALEESSAFVKDRLTSNEKTIEALAASSDKGQKTLSLLQEDVAGYKESLYSTEKQLGGRLNEDANMLTALENDLMEQKKEIAHVTELFEVLQKQSEVQESAVRHLLESKADKEHVDISLKDERAIHEEKMVLLSERIKSIEAELLWLEKQMDMVKISTGKPETESPASREDAVGGGNGRAVSPAPKKFEEQDISQ